MAYGHWLVRASHDALWASVTPLPRAFTFGSLRAFFLAEGDHDREAFALGGFAVVVGLLVGLTSLTQHDRTRWADFTEKIQGHDKQIAGYRVGFKYAMLDPDLGNRTVLAEQFEAKYLTGDGP